MIKKKYLIYNLIDGTLARCDVQGYLMKKLVKFYNLLVCCIGNAHYMKLPSILIGEIEVLFIR